MSSFFTSPIPIRNSALPPSCGVSISRLDHCGNNVESRVMGPATVVGKKLAEARYAR